MLGIFKRKAKEAPIGKIDYLVAGLGNPGGKYSRTRHNAGFLAVDLLFSKYDGGKINLSKCRSLYGTCAVMGKNILFIKPQTFMNLSGEAVRDMLKSFRIPTDHLLVIYDDIALPPGKLRVRPSGSAGGHNGIKSIIECLGTNDFARIKIGVGENARGEGEDLAEYVLSPMDTATCDACARVSDIVEEFLENGVDSARQKFN